MMQRHCQWKCGRLTDRICGICLQCCNGRDDLNRQIDAGVVAYVPPDQRPGHRFYKADKPKKAMTEAQRQSLAQARAAKSLKQMPGTPHNDSSEGDHASRLG
jgi:hypothetical protein